MSAAAVPAEVSPLARLPIEFLGSFPDPVHRLVPVLPEFAMIVRSNVGKSSLRNALVGRRSLARVSQTPGKTQLLNIYQLPSLYLIDHPGYGFAQADKGTRLAYRKLLESFLRKRTTLTGVVWLLDIRHKPSKDDGDFHTLLTDSGCAVLAVVTKADKLAERAVAIGFPLDQVQVVSAETGLGIAELGASLLAAAMEPITPEPAA